MDDGLPVLALQIIDDTTSKLEMVIEDVDELSIKIGLPFRGDVEKTFKDCTTVGEVITWLIQSKYIYGQRCKNYYLSSCKLFIEEVDYCMPLHWFGLHNGSRLTLESEMIGLKIVDEYGDKLFVRMNQNSETVLDVKRKIAGNSKTIGSEYINGNRYHPQHKPYRQQPVKVYENIEQMRLYKKMPFSSIFDLLDDKETLCGLTNGATLYLVHYDWGLTHRDLPPNSHPTPKFYVYNGDRAGSRTFLERLSAAFLPQQDYHDYTLLDVVFLPPHGSITLLSCLLRIQEQCDIPVHAMHVYRDYGGQLCDIMSERCSLSKNISYSIHLD